MDGSTAPDEMPLYCDRCQSRLVPGRGDFYVVRIHAVADPSGPRFTEEDLQLDPREEIDRLLAAMDGLSEQEALDQVYRRVTIHLCDRCFADWIEDPAGSRD